MTRELSKIESVKLTEKGRIIARLLDHIDRGLSYISALSIAYEAGTFPDEDFDVDGTVIRYKTVTEARQAAERRSDGS